MTDDIDALALRITAALAGEYSNNDTLEIARLRASLPNPGRNDFEGFLRRTERARTEFVARVLREWLAGRVGG